MNALATLIIGYIDYKDMMSFLRAFLSSKDVVIPEYQISQLKNKFLKTRKVTSGFYQHYPNGIIEGRYLCEYNNVDYEGAFINGKRHSDDASQEYLDYDLSCESKPFGYYMDKHTGYINRLVCGSVYGDINYINEDHALLFIGHYAAGRLSRIATIQYDHITIRYYTPEGELFHMSTYDIDGTFGSTYACDSRGDPHGIYIGISNDSYIVRLYDHAALVRKEIHSIATVGGQSAAITYEIVTGVDEVYHYNKSKRCYHTDKPHVNRVQIDRILSNSKIEPKFIPSQDMIKLLKSIYNDLHGF
jgi:hypothetical protein